MRTAPTAMPAQITPFTASGEIDVEAYRHNLGVQSERGVEGFLIGGSTGEGPYLEPGDRSLLVGVTREEMPDSFIMCGIAAESVRRALAQAEEAANADADAVLVLTPTSLVRGKDGLVASFYEDVATAASLPVFIYSVPTYTGYEIPVDETIASSHHANIAGIKDSGGNPVRALQMAQATDREGFKVFAGSSASLALSVAAGAYGAITASGNYAPSLVREVVGGARKGVRRAADAQERLTGLCRLVESRGIPGVRLAAAVSGLNVGLPRRPLLPLSGDEEQQLTRALSALRLQMLG